MGKFIISSTWVILAMSYQNPLDWGTQHWKFKYGHYVCDQVLTNVKKKEKDW